MKMTENEKNSFFNQTLNSCSTSSTDSGVIIIDNTTTFDNDSAAAKTTTSASATDKEEEKQQKTKNYSNSTDSDEKANATKINIQNFINISKTANGNAEQHNGPQAAAMATAPSTKRSSKNNSPTVSIRSTTISIVSIDENAIDSSVVDSDSDFEDDTEGVHNNYIVKKLGQQTTYAPNSPDIPNINKGLTVINQQISSNAAAPGVVPLANNLLKGAVTTVGGGDGTGSLAPNAPQIGSIALSNSTDVTFGDKHFYEGPVTIQQFLIDSRDKWKSQDGPEGQDNPMFQSSDDAKQAASGEWDPQRKVNNPPTPHSHQLLFNRKAVVITGVIILLTILIGALILATSNIFNSTTIQKSKQLGDGDDSRKNIPINSNIDPHEDIEVFNGTLQFVNREDWQARPHKGVMDKLKLPVHRAIISHTASDTCHNRATCADRLQVIQAFHMDSMHWDDIGYNFLIGADGLVYIGRGWDNQGAHTKGYNTDSIGVTFIGTFTTVSPNKNQLAAAQLLLAEGVRLGKLVPDYRLYGARQFSGKDNIGGGKVLRIVPRDGWLAQPPSSQPLALNLPVSRVVVISTQTEGCDTQAVCTYRVRFTQTFNIESTRYDDIIYNFLIGGDGNVYEGRGWDHKGAVLKGYNDNSISVAYIGTFRTQPPNAKQMNVTQLLLDEGVRLGKLTDDYKIIAANKIEPTSTSTSADALYASFEGWPHWLVV